MERATKVGINWAVLVLALSVMPIGASTAVLLVPEQYPTIQAALAAAQAGDVVSVGPGTYDGPVAVQSEGVTLQSRFPFAATIDGNGDHTVTCNNVTCTIEGFVITNAGALKGGVFTSQKSQVIRNNRIVGNNGTGIILSSGSVARVEGNTVTDNGELRWGIRFMTGATGSVYNNYIARNGTGIQAHEVPGLVIEHNTIVDNDSQNIAVGGTAVIRFNIIASSLYGISYTDGYAEDLQGYVSEHLHVAYNDVWNHSEFDYYAYLGGTPIANVGPFVPMPGTGEISADPLLAGVQLLPGSPCIDAGDAPEDFPGVPCRDIDGRPRLIDGNQDALVRRDIGAFEFSEPPALVPEVRQFRWESPTQLIWAPSPLAASYAVYRGDLGQVGLNHWGGCLGTTGVEFFTEPDEPENGSGFFYLVAAVDAQSAQGTLGEATCALRTTADPCFTP